MMNDSDYYMHYNSRLPPASPQPSRRLPPPPPAPSAPITSPIYASVNKSPLPTSSTFSGTVGSRFHHHRYSSADTSLPTDLSWEGDLHSGGVLFPELQQLLHGAGCTPRETSPSVRRLIQRRSFADMTSSLPSKLKTTPWYPSTGSSEGVTNWRQKCLEMEWSLQQFREQAGRVRQLLRDKLVELERRVKDAETRADEADAKVSKMETEQLSCGGLSDDHRLKIAALESQIDEQRRLRLQDAKQVEAKAAKIKEWVTNKLQELEEQNQSLRDQNDRCNDQIQLLRSQLVIHFGGSINKTPELEMILRNSLVFSEGEDFNHDYVNSTDARALMDYKRSIDNQNDEADNDPLECLESLGPTTDRTPSDDGEEDNMKPIPKPRKATHLNLKWNNDTNGQVDLGHQDPLTPILSELVEQHKTIQAKAKVRPLLSLADELHDYSEIYTPSREWPPIPSSVCPSCGSLPGRSIKTRSTPGVVRPPTPPLHRCPSWESRIYQLASEGFSSAAPSTEKLPFFEQGGSTIMLGATSSHGSTDFSNISIPVFATIKGQASEIRPVPLATSCDSSEDSSDDDLTLGGGGGATKATSTRNSGGSVTDNTRDTSFESGASDDYAIPPDAMSEDGTTTRAGADTLSLDSSLFSPQGYTSYRAIVGSPTSPRTPISSRTNSNLVQPAFGLSPFGSEPSPKRKEMCLEKSGYLCKLGGKLKTWRRRWFVLKAGVLSYWKSEQEFVRHSKPQGSIVLNESCRIIRADGISTFEILLPAQKKTYYLTTDSVHNTDEWVKSLQNVIRHNATKLLLSQKDANCSIQGWLVKVKHGHTRKCWAILIGRILLYFKQPGDTLPLGQLNIGESRVEEIVPSSESDDPDEECSPEIDPEFDLSSHQSASIGIYPTVPGPPTYLILPSKHDKEMWMYHLTVVSGTGHSLGTQFEQLVHKLMETGGDQNCVLWRHPLLLHSKDCPPSPLTTLPNESLQSDALKLFKACQLFISVPLDPAGIDYHVSLAQNALQQALDTPELQSELFSLLVKQTSRHTSQKMGVQQLLLCATQSLFACDSSGAQKGSPTSQGPPSIVPPSDSKINPPGFVFVQGWQLLSLACSLFAPKNNNQLLWYIRLHLKKNADNKSETGKYAAYCQRALERSLISGPREAKPSRMEVLSILLKNPFHHSLPHSIPVHFINGTYQVIGFDGSSSVGEFLSRLTDEIGCRPVHQSGFALFSDDPLEKDLEHCLQFDSKLSDVISQWETALREKGSGKFEPKHVVKLTFKRRLWWSNWTGETERERLLVCYQISQQIQKGMFPLTCKQLALELAALMTQIDVGDFSMNRSSTLTQTGERSSEADEWQVEQSYRKFYPERYLDTMNHDEVRELECELVSRWRTLSGHSPHECVRIFLTCTRKWPLFGATLYSSRHLDDDVYLGVTPSGLSLLDPLLREVSRFPFPSLVTFGGCDSDFMIVVQQDDSSITKLVFSLSKPKILELTLLIADYMNALGQTVPTVGGGGGSKRGGSQRSTRVGGRRGIGQGSRPLTGTSSQCGPEPDILKSTRNQDR